MVSRFDGSPAQNTLLRFTYSTSTKRYTLDAGFPVNIAGGGTEALTIAKDSTGALWIAYTLGSQVWVNRSAGSDTAWGTPFVIPVPEGTSVAADDIAAVVTMPGAIGVFWSNQANDTDYFALHSDGAAPNDPASWHLEVAARGSRVADDHMNLKLASDGRLFVAMKTSRTSADATLIGLLVRSASGTWSPVQPVVTVTYQPTRPQCVLDESAGRIYVVYSAFESAVYVKTSSLATIGFPAGIGTPLISSASTTNINNPSTTKQRIDGTTGLVVLASTPATHRYWHGKLP
jgi:hypothetical protein